ncbi:MAG: N-formylglutamate amidohydrolase [Deltaproteobacteria bacterium]|nr:N-formylglutamate amidohydrolase [Deltaproteobacteria bacterium]MBW2050286.1 N-formylglutamate amidohydrolase [Deltaproteobacteria bacterium]MBW2113174.1 N-formylglutamate amidohydrolase [Deltaproteobacteria bacterium]MBW2355141.1 N-formylglutamate amidohydrolase [Deltaproteobacteria bacterium]
MSLPFVISVPHCSGKIPEQMRTVLALSDLEIRDSTDLGTREIFASLEAEYVLCARWSRLVVDLNRDPRRLDSKGVIPLVDYFGRPVYLGDSLPDQREAEERLRNYYRPYHNILKEALARPRVRGLIDCHSLTGTGPPMAPDAGRKRRDVVLSNNGDQDGNTAPGMGPVTCAPELLDRVKNSFLRAGFSVSINAPYTGGFIVTHYAHEFAHKGKFAFQIEINQELFSELEAGKISSERLTRVKSRIRRCFDEIAEVV